MGPMLSLTTVSSAARVPPPKTSRLPTQRGGDRCSATRHQIAVRASGTEPIARGISAATTTARAAAAGQGKLCRAAQRMLATSAVRIASR